MNAEENLIEKYLDRDNSTINKANQHLKFYHGNLNKYHSEQVLLEYQKDSKIDSEIFLLRSESNSTDFILSILHSNQYYHHKINHIEDSYFKIPKENSLINGIENVIEKFKLKNFVIGQSPPDYALKFGVNLLIHQLVRNECFNLLNHFLNKNPRSLQLNSKDSNGSTALHESCFRGSQMTAILLRFGANVNIRDKDGNSPLHICCMYGHCQLLNILIYENNSKINDRNPETGLTPLHTAAVYNKSLVNSFGVFLDLKTIKNQTALELAKENKSLDAVKLLEELEKENSHFSSSTDWYHEDTKLEEAIVLLDSVGQQDGLFMIIKNETTANDCNLLFYNRKKLNNFEINYGKNGFRIGNNGRFFKNLSTLVDFHCKNYTDLKCFLKSSLSKNGKIICNLAVKNTIKISSTNNKRYRESLVFKANFKHFEQNRASLRISRLSKIIDNFQSSKDIDKLNVSAYDIELKYKIGEGEFGNVYRGNFTNECKKIIPVAVKHLKQKAKYRDFLRESKITSSLNHHCIVKFYGYCSEKQMIILELILLGSLSDFLKTKNYQITNDTLRLWCLQIADGMRYLESKLIVHRDLAARNILVTAINQVKITDFGMARKLNSNEVYHQESEQKIPYRWYPLESIQNHIFTIKSDVWSYGVTVWEIFSLGENPYENLTFDQVVKVLKSGTRLKCPLNCSKYYYYIMLQCWNLLPFNRPSFDLIFNYFNKSYLF